MIHSLELEARTLHGSFWREQAAVLEIDPGDTVVFRTLDFAGRGGASTVVTDSDRTSTQGRNRGTR